jgi:hypothetical protein
MGFGAAHRIRAGVRHEQAALSISVRIREEEDKP